MQPPPVSGKLANYESTAHCTCWKISKRRIFINMEVVRNVNSSVHRSRLLAHSHTHAFRHCLWSLPAPRHTGRVQKSQHRLLGPRSQKSLPLVPSRKTFTWCWFLGKRREMPLSEPDLERESKRRKTINFSASLRNLGFQRTLWWECYRMQGVGRLGCSIQEREVVVVGSFVFMCHKERTWDSHPKPPLLKGGLAITLFGELHVDFFFAVG